MWRARYIVEDKNWSTMELNIDMRSLLGSGGDVREQASESMISFVVANLSYMVFRGTQRVILAN